jgi:hypothetical protein
MRVISCRCSLLPFARSFGPLVARFSRQTHRQVRVCDQLAQTPSLDPIFYLREMGDPL